MILIRRHDSARALPAAEILKECSKRAMGMVPELCPAIREFQSRGAVIFSPREIKFQSAYEFDVEVRKNRAGDSILIPGVIGSPGVKRFYARIDSGFSLRESNTSLLGIIYQGPGSMQENIELPPVIYPKGYTGPILIPVSGYKSCLITETTPLLHLQPLSEVQEDLVLSDEYIDHPRFEGLVYRGFENEFPEVRLCKSTDLLAPGSARD